tara:strand:- start:375 stop:839 length:465 start_codon:yes stop_codon:yes gene_type:complete
MKRRTFILATIFSPFLINSKSYSIELIPIHVFKDPNCGCCNEWIKILKTEGFNVTSENMFSTDLVQFKIKNNIPINMVSCHTAKVDNYLIEGHVPSSDIKSLVNKQIDVIGLAVPEMPYGSPGMGPEHKREAYDVFLINKDGTTTIFNSYNANV